jgi:hypothetical protein
MYLKFRLLVTDGHDTLTLTSLTLLYRYDTVLYMRSQFLMLNTFCHAWSRLVMLCFELHYIVGFDLYPDSMTLVVAT